MPSNHNALLLNQSSSYGLALSALVPDNIKGKIWDRKYIDMRQLYQIQTSGEIKHDFSVNISNQGPSTMVKVQPKQAQGQDLTINQWLTAFNCYMDVYVQKFPNQMSGLLAYMNLIRDLERSCGMQAFNYYDRSFRAHRQSQDLPWGRMQTEIWNKAILFAFPKNQTQTSGKSNVAPAFKGGNRKFCFQFNSAQGCTRQQCQFNHVCSFCFKKHSRVNCFALLNQGRQPMSHGSHPPDSQAASSQSVPVSNSQGTGMSAVAIQNTSNTFRGNKK